MRTASKTNTGYVMSQAELGNRFQAQKKSATKRFLVFLLLFICFSLVKKVACLNGFKLSCLKAYTSDHERPRMTASDHEWLRVTTSENASKYFADVKMTLWLHHFIKSSLFNDIWTFLKTLIPGFDISTDSEWGGEEEGGQTSCQLHPLISVLATF